MSAISSFFHGKSLVENKPYEKGEFTINNTVADHASVLVITRKGHLAQSTIGLGVSKLTEGGNTLLYKASEVLIKAAIPAAALAWPI